MVLDYLKETKDKPNQELLDRLNWTEDDLKRFSDRWEKVRDIDNVPNNQPNSDVEEALEESWHASTSGRRNVGNRRQGGRPAKPARLWQPSSTASRVSRRLRIVPSRNQQDASKVGVLITVTTCAARLRM